MIKAESCQLLDGDCVGATLRYQLRLGVERKTRAK